MINILIPIAGKSRIFEDQFFPKPLFEINDRTMIEYPLTALNRIQEAKRFAFVAREDECVKFHLDKTLKLLTGKDTVIIRQQTETKGAACSCLLAVDHINNDSPLIISNADQYLDIDYNVLLKYFRDQDLDGGVVCFDSVHPQWSYARLDADRTILQTAEKTPSAVTPSPGFTISNAGATSSRPRRRPSKSRPTSTGSTTSPPSITSSSSRAAGSRLTWSGTTGIIRSIPSPGSGNSRNSISKSR